MTNCNNGYTIDKDKLACSSDCISFGDKYAIPVPSTETNIK